MPVNPATVTVRSGPRRTVYHIRIADGLLDAVDRELASVAPDSRCLVVSSSRVWQHHGSRVTACLPSAPVLLVNDGERSKHLGTVARLYSSLLDARADRRTVMVIVGGGVLGDLAGYAAATFLRGMPVVQVPTTVVGQVDSAIGGKVGVNHVRGKNLIGAFHPPLAVLCDPTLLQTLPERELRAGLYEVIKYGVISDARLFRRLERTLQALLERDPAALVDAVSACVRIKAHVVSIDEHETGLRRILNFGHTIGHALEAVTGYRRFRHGEAVGWGMLAAAEVARHRRDLSDEDAARLSTVVDRVGPRPPVDDLSAAACVSATARDKKVVSGTLHFVLPVRIGATRIVADVTPGELTRALRSLGMSA